MGPAFTEAEHRDRLRRARRALAEAGLDAAICVAPEHLYYFAGYDAHTHFSQQALVFSANEDEPVLVIRDADLASALETSWVRDVRLYHHGSERPADVVAAVVREKGLAGGRLGLELDAYALPASYYLALAFALGPGTRLEDSGRVLGWLRVTKSEAELRYVREAAAHSRAGLDAAFAAIRPGSTEIQLAGVIEGALRQHGSDYPAMPVFIWSGPRTAAGHAMPTDRVIAAGEPAMVTFAGVSHRYHVSAYHSVHVGPPGARYRALYGAASESMQAMVAEVRVGAPVAAAARAAHESLQRAGLAEHSKVRYGYGVGIGYPPAWLEPLDIIEGSAGVFGPGMVFCLHVMLSLPGEGLGVMIGGDYLLSGQGLEPLDRTGGSPERRELLVL